MCAAAVRAGGRFARRRDHRCRRGRRRVREHRHARLDRRGRARRRRDRHRADAARDHAGASRVRLDRNRDARPRGARQSMGSRRRRDSPCGAAARGARSNRRGGFADARVTRCSAGRRCTRRRSRAAPECRPIPIAASCGSSDARFPVRRRPTCERELEAACARIAKRSAELSGRRAGYFLSDPERRERRRADRRRARASARRLRRGASNRGHDGVDGRRAAQRRGNSGDLFRSGRHRRRARRGRVGRDRRNRARDASAGAARDDLVQRSGRKGRFMAQLTHAQYDATRASRDGRHADRRATTGTARVRPHSPAASACTTAAKRSRRGIRPPATT